MYKKGSQNTNANALSRVASMKTEKEHSVRLDEERKKQILYKYHDAPVGGHRGMNLTLRAIKAKYSWPNMRKDVENYVKQCRSCQVNNNTGTEV